MLYLVTGGSGSGKSAYAETLAVDSCRKIENAPLYYIATMAARDEESIERIKKHRKQRQGKGFLTIEHPCGLGDLFGQKISCRQKTLNRQKNLYGQEAPCILENGVVTGAVILLECMSNLLANEMYLPEGELRQPESRTIAGLEQAVLKPLQRLAEQAEAVIVVTNEVFSAGTMYEEETRQYLFLLGEINQRLAKEADCVVEVVYGIPLYQKGAAPC